MFPKSPLLILEEWRWTFSKRVNTWIKHLKSIPSRIQCLDFMEKWKEFQDQSQLVSLGLCSPQPTAFHKHSDENPVKSHLVWQLMYNYTLSQFIFIKGSLIYNIHLEILVFITFYCLCQKATCLLITLPATYCKNNFKKYPNCRRCHNG